MCDGQHRRMRLHVVFIVRRPRTTVMLAMLVTGTNMMIQESLEIVQGSRMVLDVSRGLSGWWR